jgi:hypothetical protein
MTSRNEMLSTTENVQARHVTAKYGPHYLPWVETDCHKWAKVGTPKNTDIISPLPILESSVIDNF